MELHGFSDNSLIECRNIEDFGFVKDFKNPKSRVSLDFDSLILVNDSYKKLYKHIYTDLGRFENIPATITEGGHDYPHYLDLQGVRFTDDEAEVKIQSRKGTDHFFEDADGTTFELLYNQNGLSDSLFVDVPFLIIPDNLQLQRIVSIAINISLIQQLEQVIKSISDLGADYLDAVGTGILTALAKTVILAIWLAITIIELTISMNQLKELYFPKVRYLKACSDYNLIERGCAFLGYTLDSTFLSTVANTIYTIPIPQSKPDQSIIEKLFDEFQGYFNTGYPRAQDTTPTIWSLIDYYLNAYNLRIFVYDGIVKIERRSYFIDNSTVVIKKTYSLQAEKSREWTYNDEDTWGRKYLRWTTDFSDCHSSDTNTGTQSENITQPITTVNYDLFRAPGLREYLFPFSWAARKNKLTRIEEFVYDIFLLVDELSSIMGGSSNFAASVINRIGVMIIESQFFSITKKVVLNSEYKQPVNYTEILRADNIYQLYHTDLEVSNNCFKYEKMRIPFTWAKFYDLLKNNFVTLDTGEVVEVKDISWKNRKYSADITLAIPDTSAFNVKTVKLV